LTTSGSHDSIVWGAEILTKTVIQTLLSYGRLIPLVLLMPSPMIRHSGMIPMMTPTATISNILTAKHGEHPTDQTVVGLQRGILPLTDGVAPTVMVTGGLTQPHTGSPAPVALATHGQKTLRSGTIVTATGAAIIQWAQRQMSVPI
jgi:hypothetical protein